MREHTTRDPALLIGDRALSDAESERRPALGSGSESPRVQPVVVIGMHRSGTSMITRLLEQAGLFMGWRKQSDDEATFFLALNDWLLCQAGGAWDHPQPVNDLCAHSQVRSLAADYLGFSLRTPRVISYLGPAHYLRHRAPTRLPFAWGWKDPRTTFTLPIWLDLFPHARVIHVRRHGVDVANSLRVRHEKILASRRKRYRRLRFLYLLRAKQVGFTTSLRCADLAGGFSLWEEYMRRGRAQMAAVGDRGLDVKYEDFLANPRHWLVQLADFCGLSIPSARKDEVVKQLRSDRAFAFARSPELVDFGESVKDRLSAFGY